MKMNPEKLKKLQSLLEGSGEEVPEGWFTIVQLCKLFSKTRTPVSNRIRYLLTKEPDKIEKKMFTIRTENGLHRIPHYKFKGL